MEIVKIQQALRAIGLYEGRIDGIPGPLTRKAALEFYPMLVSILTVPDAMKLEKENKKMKNDIRVAREALLGW
jgi:hypothetical protein